MHKKWRGAGVEWYWSGRKMNEVEWSGVEWTETGARKEWSAVEWSGSEGKEGGWNGVDWKWNVVGVEGVDWEWIVHGTAFIHQPPTTRNRLGMRWN